jgi:hypothetical protein
MDLLGRRGRGCRGHIPLRLGKKGFKGVGVAIIIKFIFQLEKEVSCHHYRYNIYIPCAISNALYPAQTSDIHVDPVNIQKGLFL